MAEFAGDLNSFKPCLPFWEMDSNNHLIHHFGELTPSFLENPNLIIQSNMGFSNDNFLSQPQQEFPANFAINLPGFFSMDDSHANANANAAPVDHSLASAEDSKKRKAMQVSDTSSGTPVVENGLGENNKKTKKKNNSGRGKRGRNNEKEVEKPKEVIHVRARRGQATDSHSLAERVRREKINEKLRSLQDLVPGCYKTMGMAVMLDEIITYVQSLQNQVEFLSMKLTAASNFYDFNSDVEVTQTQTQTMQQGTNAYEAQEVERLVRGGYGGLSCFQSTWPL